MQFLLTSHQPGLSRLPLLVHPPHKVDRVLHLLLVLLVQFVLFGGLLVGVLLAEVLVEVLVVIVAAEVPAAGVDLVQSDVIWVLPDWGDILPLVGLVRGYGAVDLVGGLACVVALFVPLFVLFVLLFLILFVFFLFVFFVLFALFGALWKVRRSISVS